MTTKAERIADWAGPLGSAFAALCCLGLPFIVGAITAAGLGFLRSDPILWPLMIASIGLALWGLWRGWRTHRNAGPFILGFLAGLSLVAGVIFVHGFPAKELIYGGSAAIIAASIWNVAVRTQCEKQLATPVGHQ